MKIITQLIILPLSLQLVSAQDNRRYCSNLINKFKKVCTIKSCCNLNYFSSDYAKSEVLSGVYKMSSSLTNFGNAVDVYCDMATDGGGWIVMQRNNISTSMSFNRNWVEYEEGFGDLDAEFWYGLKIINYLTDNGQWEMRVDFLWEDGGWSYLHYNQFSVGRASEEYPLTVGGFTGAGSDMFNFGRSYSLNGMKFSTPDNNNDMYSNGNCSSTSGWWFNSCSHIDINRQPPYHYYIYSRFNTPVVFTEMKIRPKDCKLSK